MEQLRNVVVPASTVATRLVRRILSLNRGLKPTASFTRSLRDGTLATSRCLIEEAKAAAQTPKQKPDASLPTDPDVKLSLIRFFGFARFPTIRLQARPHHTSPNRTQDSQVATNLPR
jgi:hypothetical protein